MFGRQLRATRAFHCGIFFEDILYLIPFGLSRKKRVGYLQSSMQRFLPRSTFSATRSRGLPASNLCRFHHPNPGNFQNRSKEQMSNIGRKGGRKGGKARGVGGFKSMDPEKQVRISYFVLKACRMREGLIFAILLFSMPSLLEEAMLLGNPYTRQIGIALPLDSPQQRLLGSMSPGRRRSVIDGRLAG